MAYTLTVQQVKESSIQNIAGQCVNSSSFIQTLNEITKQLMRRGGWYGTEVLMRLCTTSCVIAWPRVVGTILGLRFCRGGALTLRNNWFPVYGWRSCAGWRAGWRGDVVGMDNGTVPCQNQISGNSGKYLRLHIVHIQDVGKTVKVFGFRFGNQPLEELDSNGNWVPGITITATQTDVTTSILVTQITSIIKEESQGRMWLYSVDPSSGDLELLSMYEASEKNPAYRSTRIQNWGGIPFHTDSNGQRVRSVEALVKLEFIEATAEDDFVLVDNISALKAAFQAFRLEEANDDAGAEIKWAKAIRELNFEIRDRTPSLQTTIMVNSISSDYPICNPC